MRSVRLGAAIALLALVAAGCGAYQQTLFSGLFDSPALHQVRADDLIHLSVDGAFRTSWWTMAALRGKWGAP